MGICLTPLEIIAKDPRHTGLLYLLRFRERDRGKFLLRCYQSFLPVEIRLCVGTRVDVGVDVVRLGVVAQQRRRHCNDGRRVNAVGIGSVVFNVVVLGVVFGHVFYVVDAISRVLVLAKTLAHHSVRRFVP